MSIISNTRLSSVLGPTALEPSLKSESAIIGCCSNLAVLKLLSLQKESHSRNLSLESISIV